MRCGQWSSAALLREAAAACSLRRQRRQGVSRQICLQLIAGSGETQHLPRPAQCREAGARAFDLDLLNRTPHQGARARPETAAAPPQPKGEAAPARGSPGSPGPSKSSTCLSAGGASPTCWLHAAAERLGFAVVQSNLNSARPTLKPGAPAPLTASLKLTLSAVPADERSTNKQPQR